MTSSHEFYPITGVPLPQQPDPSHPIPVRKEINEWTRDNSNEVQVALYLIALDRFQQKTWTDMLSYFQIAGIHGFPSQVWDNSGSKGFYCAHQLPTFPTFHRAYLTLYEQALYGCMLDYITSDVPPDQQAPWTTAAQTWRLPYWDYAVSPQLPDIATEPTISIKNPRGGAAIVLDPNPMYTYRFSKDSSLTMGDPSLGDFAIEDDDNFPWSKCKGTSRHAITPDDNSWVNGVSKNDQVRRALSNPDYFGSKASGTIKENVYRLFTDDYFHSWRTFASTKYYDGDQTHREWLSLEAIHNMIHLWTGGITYSSKVDPDHPDQGAGVGHMMDVPVAAFDPIFWLHHCFIDRAAAIWQEKTDDKFWFDNPLNNDPKPEEPLRPFHKKATEPDADYTSNDVRTWRPLHYEYEILETRPTDYNTDGTLNRNKYKAHIDQDLNSLYSTTRREVLSAIKAGDSELEQNKHDYIVNVLYNRYAINGGEPYVIHVFVGAVQASETEIAPVSPAFSPNRVGSIATFSSPFETAEGRVKCSNCKTQVDDGVLSCAQIPITGALIKDVEQIDALNNISPEIMELYLQAELTWKAFKMTGEEISLDSLTDLKITLLVGTGVHDRHSQVLSTYSDYSPLYKATNEKQGGAKASS